jgi:RNA polymerase sigma-70 factor (ECF subfamily)
MSMQNRSPEELDRLAVTRALAGDQAAYRELYHRNQNPIRRIGAKVLRRREDLDDFVQDVFFKVFDRLPSFRGTGRFRSWASRIAFTTAFNARSRGHTDEQLDPKTLANMVPDRDSGGPEARLMGRELTHALRTAVAELPSHYRRVVDLVSGFRLKFQEASDITDVPVNTLKSHFRRAKEQIRRSLGRLGYPGPGSMA